MIAKVAITSILVSTALRLQAFAQFTPNAEFSNRIRSSFRQGQEGNCGSIALIKAAMGTFGLADSGGVFKEDHIEGDSHRVILRDGAVVVVTNGQIDTAAKASKFKIPIDKDTLGDPEILKRAYFLYAVMAGRALTLSTDRTKSFGWAGTFDSALSHLGHQGNVDDIDELLGVDAKDVSDENTDANPSYIYSDNYHAAFATGNTFDQYGGSEPVSVFFDLHRRKFFPVKTIWKFILLERTPSVAAAISSVPQSR